MNELGKEEVKMKVEEDCKKPVVNLIDWLFWDL
jgi:hypothetical protein